MRCRETGESVCLFCGGDNRVQIVARDDGARLQRKRELTDRLLSLAKEFDALGISREEMISLLKEEETI